MKVTSEHYKFQDPIRGEEIELYYEGENIAIDIQPNTEHPRYQELKNHYLPGYEIIMPVAEVENLISALQDMAKNIRAQFPDAA